MNHKRKRPKSRRAGCLMCKPHKHQRASKWARLLARDLRKAALWTESESAILYA